MQNSKFVKAGAAVLALLSLVLLLGMASPLLAQTSACPPNIKRNYDRADLHYNSYEFESAAQVLLELIRSPQFDSLGVDCCKRIADLLAKVFEQLTSDRAVAPLELQKAFFNILKVMPNFRLENLQAAQFRHAFDEALKDYQNWLKAQATRCDFQFAPFKQTYKLKPGSKQQVLVTTLPETTSVAFALVEERPNVSLRKLAGVANEAELVYSALASEAGTIQSVVVTATCGENAQTAKISFEIEAEKSGGWKKWALIGGGGVVAGTVAYLLLGGKDDVTGDALGNPPNPPNR